MSIGIEAVHFGPHLHVTAATDMPAPSNPEFRQYQLAPASFILCLFVSLFLVFGSCF